MSKKPEAPQSVVTIANAASITALPVDAVNVLPQVRKVFDMTRHQELTANIKLHGIIQPLIVRITDTDAGPRYDLIAGERRLRAAKEAGLRSVPVRVLAHITGDAIDLQLVENIQREALSLEETAAGVDALYRKAGKMSAVAEALSKSMPWVSKMIAVHNSLGPNATELLTGGHTQDIELLTTLSRCEALENSYPRADLVTAAIMEKKDWEELGRSGRQQVKDLYETLKQELDDSTDDKEEGGESAPAAPNFTAVDTIHATIKATVADIIAHPAGVDIPEAINGVMAQCDAYRAHVLNLFKTSQAPDA